MEMRKKSIAGNLTDLLNILMYVMMCVCVISLEMDRPIALRTRALQDNR